LASLYLPLAAAANVPSELLRLADLAWPIGLTIGVATAAWLLMYAASRDGEKAALAAVVGVGAYSSLGAVIKPLRDVLNMKGIDPAPLVLLLYGIIVGGLVVALIPARVRLRALLNYLTTMAALLVGWNAAVIVHSLIRTDLPPAPPVAADVKVSAAARASQPDIYLIVLDKYSSSESLSSNFGFDNSRFEAALRQRGFVVPARAHANYAHTFLALAAMLNLRYLDDLAAKFGSRGEWELAYPLVENNRLVSFLRARGYQIISFPSSFAATRQNRYADLQIPNPRDVRPEVYAVWVHYTAGPLLRQLFCKALGCEGDPPPYVPSTPNVIDWQFDALASLPSAGSQPRFIFAHLLVPHEPYMYSRDCKHRPPYWPQHDLGERAGSVRQAYVDQVQCVNRKLLQAIDSIQARSRIRPVILVQSDHGHGRLGRDLPGVDIATPEAIAERASLFAAYALPGVSRDSVPDAISPVNAARLLLRAYFGAELPALPEHMFWSSTYHPYHFAPTD
jgi:hypothetical protein